MIRITGMVCLTGMLTLGLAGSPGLADGHTEEDQVLAAVKRQSEAFMKRDVDSLVANMNDDFMAYRMSDDGPQAVIQGREQAAEMLSRTLGQSSSYRESEITERLVVKDMVIQVEEDTFERDGGMHTSTTVAIYRVKDGKMWRAYNFRLPD